MGKFEIVNKVTRALGRTGLALKKHSPEILVAAGVVGTVTSTILACKATTKVTPVLEKAKENIDGVHKVLEDPQMQEIYVETYGEEYSVEQSKKDLTIIYAQTAVELVKLYAPAVIIGTLSLTAILSSNKILRQRNVALAGAFAAVSKDFKDYRGRVVERFGEGLDRELRYNIKAVEVNEVVKNEDGTETVVKKTVEVVDPNTLYDEFSIVFDDGCHGWTKDPEANKVFLMQQERYLTDLLRSRGFLKINDVREALGVHKTMNGETHGWIYDEKNPIGDNYVSFNIFDISIPSNRRFINGYERNILINLNHDGYLFSADKELWWEKVFPLYQKLY